MCRKSCKLIIVILAAVTVLAAATGYFTFVSSMIYEESTSHLTEIYTQANKVFNSAMSDKWNNICDWLPYLEKAESDEKMADYIRDRQKQWGFQEFYFISKEGEYITVDGLRGNAGLGKNLSALIKKRQRVVSSSALPQYPELTLFAVPSFRGSYHGFEFEAIGISINNRRISKSLEISAFDGCSETYVVDLQGRVILRDPKLKRDLPKIEFNLISWLETETNMGHNKIETLAQEIKEHKGGVTQFKWRGQGFYMVHEPSDFEEWSVIGLVPANVVNASMSRLQAITIPAISALAILIFGVLIWLIISESRKNLAAKETEILYREELFSLLSNNVADVFIIIDAENFNVNYVSPNIERILGLDRESVTKDIRLVDELASGPDTIRVVDKLPDIALGEQKQFEREYIHNKTGEYLWFIAKICRTEINGQQKFVAVLSNRTKERLMNQTLSNALEVARSANAAKSNFLANMSHDIRTPINAIVGFSTLLQRSAEKPDKVRDYSQKIVTSGKHLLGLINDVLDMSKIESGRTSLNLTEFSLSELFNEVYTIVIPQMRTKKIHFELRSRGRIPERVLGDRLRVNQILLNLLSNAIKYTPENGDVTLTVEGTTKSIDNRVNLRFVVADNGYGMSSEFLKIVFEPFAREDNPKLNDVHGTGLGMAITKNIVELMGGTISVESMPERGSTFTVDLELKTVKVEPDIEFWQKHGISRILVADDQEEVCVDVRELMAGTGVEVDCAIGGKEAVRMAAAAAEIHEEYHVIILEWKMKDLDGIETARRIRERVAYTNPILVLSAYDFEQIEQEAKKEGIDAFMQKPFFLSSFHRIVSETRDLHSRTAGEDCETSAYDRDKKPEFYGMRVLAAEDYESNAEILTELLKDEGIECDVVCNGKEAVERFVSSDEGYYDMIFMDIGMPVMDGYEATRCIRNSRHPDAKRIPIAAMTAYAFEEDVRRAFEAGMDAHTAKPIDIENVKKLIRQLRNKE